MFLWGFSCKSAGGRRPNLVTPTTPTLTQAEEPDLSAASPRVLEKKMKKMGGPRQNRSIFSALSGIICGLRRLQRLQYLLQRAEHLSKSKVSPLLSQKQTTQLRAR